MILCKTSCGYTSLIWASRNGRTEIVKMLLSHGVDVNVKNNCNYTALMFASRYDHIEIVKVLPDEELYIKNESNEKLFDSQNKLFL